MIQDVHYTIVNIYAPHVESERTPFFEYLASLQFSSENVILLGDFNCYVDLSRDRWPCPLEYYSGSEAMQDTMNDFNLVDTIPSDSHGFSIMTRVQKRKSSPISATRIDAIWISSHLLTSTRDHTTTNIHWSDHKMVSLSLIVQTNSDLPRWDKLLPSNVTGKIVTSKLDTFNQSLLNNLNPDPMDILNQWVTLKSDIVASKTKQASSQWRKWLAESNRAYKVLSHLEANCPKSGYSEKWSKEWSIQKAIVDKHAAREHSMARIKAAARYTRNDERSTKQFLSKFKSRSASKSLNSAKDQSGNSVDTPEEISRVCQEFYSALYAQDPGHSSPSCPPEFFNLSTRQDPSDSLMYPATLEELSLVVKSLPRDKCPGPDGIPYEFYKKNFHILGKSLLTLVNTCLSHATTIPGSGDSYVITLYKKGDPENLANWRPIALSNTDTKLINKLMATRLGKISSSRISAQQFGFVPDRSIWDNIHSVTNATRDPHAKGILMFLDQEKAYDRVDWKYATLALQHAGVDNKFIQWSIQQSASSNIKVIGPGFITDKIAPQRGFRQGDPLSPLLYNFSIDPLIRALNKKISGIEVRGQDSIKCLAFADDCVVGASSASDVLAIQELFSLYEKSSQAKLNTRKSQILPLNDSKIKPPKGMVTPTEPIRHLGILLNKFGTADQAIEHHLLSGISSRISGWKCQDLSIIGRVQLINTFILSKLIYTAHIIPFSTSFFNSLKSIIQKFLWNKVPPVKIEILFGPRSIGGIGLINPRVIAQKMFEKFLFRIIQHPSHNESGWHIATRIIMGRSLHLASPTIITTLSKYLSSNKGATGPFTTPQYWRSILRNLKDNKITLTYSHQPIKQGARAHTYILAKDNIPVTQDLSSVRTQEPITPEIASKLEPASIQMDSVWDNCFNKCLAPKIQANTWKVLRMVYRTAERNQPSLRSCIHCGQYDSVTHRFFNCKTATAVWEKASSLAYFKTKSPAAPENNWFFETLSPIHPHVRSTLFSIALWTIYSAFLSSISSNPLTPQEITLRFIRTLTRTVRMVIHGFRFKKELSHIPSIWEQLPFLGTNPDTGIKWVEFPALHTTTTPDVTASPADVSIEPQPPP